MDGEDPLTSWVNWEKELGMPNPTLSPGSGISPPAEGTQSRPAPAIKQGACVGRGSLHCPVLHVSGWWVGLILGAY